MNGVSGTGDDLASASDAGSMNRQSNGERYRRMSIPLVNVQVILTGISHLDVLEIAPDLESCLLQQHVAPSISNASEFFSFSCRPSRRSRLGCVAPLRER